MRSLSTGFLMVVALATLAPPAHAQLFTATEHDQALASLHGLAGFHLAVEVEKSGSLTDPMLDVVVLRDTLLQALRAAHLEVLPPEAFLADDTLPQLLLHVNAMDMGRGLIPFALSLRLQQPARLDRTPGLVFRATTWESELVGLVSSDRTALIRAAAVDLALGFADDFQRINP